MLLGLQATCGIEIINIDDKPPGRWGGEGETTGPILTTYQNQL